jgi:hypothetical protein
MEDKTMNVTVLPNLPGQMGRELFRKALDLHKVLYSPSTEDGKQLVPP